MSSIDPLPTLPFAPLGPLAAEIRGSLGEAALAANSRYVEGFLEARNYCPFARQGREAGATDRLVHLAETTELTPVLEFFARAAADESLEVVQVIMPLLVAEPGEFVQFVQELTRHGNDACGGADVFAPAAFHPALPFRAESPLTVIPLFRRAPDPTIQWTRNTVLARIYEGRRGGKVFVDIADVEQLLERPPPRDLYDDISRANHARAAKAPFAAIAEELHSLHCEAQTAYQRILAAAAEA